MTTRTEDTPDVLRRREILERMDQERKYKKMVSDVEHPKSKLNFLPQKRQSSLHSAGVGLNILIAALTAFFFGYWAGWSYFRDTSNALYAGILCGGGMLALETVLYISRARRLNTIQKHRRKKHRQDRIRRAKRTKPSREALEAREALASWLKSQGITTEEGDLIKKSSSS